MNISIGIIMAVSTLSLAVSTATLFLVIKGGKEVQVQVEQVRLKADAVAQKTRAFLKELGDI